jgi:hemerythrin
VGSNPTEGTINTSMDRLKHYLTGIATLDHTHCELFSFLKMLKVKKSITNEECFQYVVKLQAHFLQEEQMMAEVGYPFAKAHADLHKEVIYLMGKKCANASVFMIDSCIERLMNHIDNYDIQFGNWIKENMEG